MNTVKPCAVSQRTNRIVLGQIENVVLHDPGWHNQHRLGPYLVRGRLVLDQFHQFVAQDDAARCGGDLLAHLEPIDPGRRIAAQRATKIVEKWRAPSIRQ
jgi:hypothetical protein